MLGVTIMRRMRDLAQIQLRKENKDECLNQSDKETQRHQCDGDQPVSYSRSQMRDRIHHLFVGKHVAEKTNAERKRPDEVADELNRKDQPRDPPDGSGKVFQVQQKTFEQSNAGNPFQEPVRYRSSLRI